MQSAGRDVEIAEVSQHFDGIGLQPYLFPRFPKRGGHLITIPFFNQAAGKTGLTTMARHRRGPHEEQCR